MPKQNIEKSPLMSEDKSRGWKSSFLGQDLSCHRIGIASDVSKSQES